MEKTNRENMTARDPYLVSIGQRIQAIRKANKINVRDFAVLCGIHYTAINFIEVGRAAAKITTLKTIADKLGVDIKDFL